MCGIFAYITKDPKNLVFNHTKIHNNFLKIKNRGPDNTQYELVNNVALGFHRLSINDVTSAGNQPMKYKDYYLICNGEIFNHLDIKSKYGFKTNSNSDCEIILHLYDYLINNSSNPNKSFLSVIKMELTTLILKEIIVIII